MLVFRITKTPIRTSLFEPKFVAGKRNFQRGDKEAETTLEIQGRRCRDKITLGNSANSGLIAGFREISVRTRMRGGERSHYRTGLRLKFPGNREKYREKYELGLLWAHSC